VYSRGPGGSGGSGVPLARSHVFGASPTQQPAVFKGNCPGLFSPSHLSLSFCRKLRVFKTFVNRINTSATPAKHSQIYIIRNSMNKQPLADFFQQNSNMSLKTIMNITDHFEERNFLKNEFFLKAGKVCDFLYLAKGVMRAYTFDLNGNEVTTNFFAKNRRVYDQASFFLQTPSEENIQAITDCLAYSITYENMNTLFHSIPEFREYGRDVLVKELVYFKKRTLAMINKTAEQRYEDLIRDDKEIFQVAQLKHIASYLGVTNSSLSRIRREFATR